MTGKLAWETKILDYKKGAKQSSGPIIAEGLAITGRSCEPEGGPDACVITAHDARTGKEVWRTSTIARGDDPNDKTWGGTPLEKRTQVGAWMNASYDPELHLLYMGTSVSAPTPKFLLAGNDYTYLYHNSTLALDVKTGKIVWHYQHIVDHWDLDHPFPRILLDETVAPDPKEVTWINPKIVKGKTYKVVTGVPGKTGVVYTLDRDDRRSSCGRGRRCSRTWSSRSTAGPARSRSIPKPSSNGSGRSATCAPPRPAERTTRRRPTAR